MRGLILLNPAPIIQLATGYWASRAFLAAEKLGVFKALSGKGLSLENLVSETAVQPEKLNILLGVLKNVGLVESKGDDFFVLSELASAYLDPKAPAYLGDALGYAREMYPLWNELEDCMLREDVDPLPPSKKETPSFLKGMDQRAELLIPLLLPHYKMKKEESLLDVACGAGSWSLAFQKEYAIKSPTLVEQPELLEHTKKYVEAKGLVGGIFEGADYRKWSPSQQWDSVLYFGAMHQERENDLGEILEKFWQWVKPGGRLVVLDIFYSPEEKNSLFAYLFGLNIALTSRGLVHNLSKVVVETKKLPEVSAVESIRLDGETPYYLITITKEG